MAELSSEVDVQSVDVEGQSVLLCARGSSGNGARTAAMDAAARGVARILTCAPAA